MLVKEGSEKLRKFSGKAKTGYRKGGLNLAGQCDRGKELSQEVGIRSN